MRYKVFQKNASICNAYKWKENRYMTVLELTVQFSTETVFLHQVELLLDAEAFTVSTISSSACIPPVVHLLPDLL